MLARFVVPGGTRAWLRVYWDTYDWADGEKSYVTGKNSCPSSFVDRDGKKHAGVHSAMALIGDVFQVQALEHFGSSEDYPAERWPTKCEGCGADVPLGFTAAEGVRPGLDLHRHILTRTLYAAPGATDYHELGPGDMWYADWYPCAEGGGCIYGWTNCDGKHLIVCLPNDHHWDTGARASNCGSKDEKTHRCWVRHGRPELGEIVHVDKAGKTCSAGAGSIAVPGYHGFLHNGDIHESCKSTCGRWQGAGR